MQAGAADPRPREAGDRSPSIGTGPARSGAAARVAWSLWGLTVGLLAGGVVLEALNHTGHALLWQQSLALTPMSLSFATVGALIGSRRAGNPIGWLCLAFGVVVAELLCAWQYATYALVTAPGSLPGGDWAAWAAIWPIELSALLPILVFLLFPHGRLLSAGWRLLAWLAVAASTVQLLASALSDVNYSTNVPFAHHPLGLLDPDIAGIAYSTAQQVTLAVLLGAMVSLVVRLRRARGQERQQLKWLVYTTVVGAVAFTVATGLTEEPVTVAIFWFPAVAVAIGVAIFKYRLYEIDRIINRTLVYGLLTAVLGLGYAGAVLVLGQLFGGMAGDPPSWAVAGATLAVAALFQPARRRIQQVVDRRFNRRRHDAARTIEAFSGRLREHIDLDTLSAELVGVVDQTMQPTQVSLWLRPATTGSKGPARPPGLGGGSGSAARS
jgi:hypothetical protein